MAGTFSLDISAFVAKANGKLDLVVRKISFEISARVVLRSPVDTGRFRGNWFVTVGAPYEGTTEVFDKSGSATVARAEAAIAKVVAGDVIFLVNNLPYGPSLERGHSKQAPMGMVGITVAEFQQVVSAAASQAKRSG